MTTDQMLSEFKASYRKRYRVPEWVDLSFETFPDVARAWIEWQAAYAAGMERAAVICEAKWATAPTGAVALAATRCADAIRAEIKEKG